MTVNSVSDLISERVTKEVNRAAIRALFTRHGYTQTQLAKDAGVFPSAISQWFSGRTTSKKIERVALRKAKSMLEKQNEGKQQ